MSAAPECRSTPLDAPEGRIVRNVEGRMTPDLPTATSDTWNTPATFLEFVRAVVGGIDVDPASNDPAQVVVQALDFYTLETDGLSHEWHGRVFLNPPYSDPAPFVAKLLAELEAGRTTEAIALVNARTGSGWFQSLAARAWRCEIRKRIEFWRPDRPEGSTGRTSSVAFYLGAVVDRFVDVFHSLGTVTAPALSVTRSPCCGCGGILRGVRADALYCSGACRQRAYRRRGGVLGLRPLRSRPEAQSAPAGRARASDQVCGHIDAS